MMTPPAYSHHRLPARSMNANSTSRTTALMTREMRPPFRRSSRNSRRVVRLKPKRCSITNCEYSDAGMPSTVKKAPTAST